MRIQETKINEGHDIALKIYFPWFSRYNSKLVGMSGIMFISMHSYTNYMSVFQFTKIPSKYKKITKDESFKLK